MNILLVKCELRDDVHGTIWRVVRAYTSNYSEALAFASWITGVPEHRCRVLGPLYPGR